MKTDQNMPNDPDMIDDDDDRAKENPMSEPVTVLSDKEIADDLNCGLADLREVAESVYPVVEKFFHRHEAQAILSHIDQQAKKLAEMEAGQDSDPCIAELSEGEASPGVFCGVPRVVHHMMLHAFAEPNFLAMLRANHDNADVLDGLRSSLSAAEEQIRQLRESGKAIFGVCESLSEGMRLIAEATGLGDIPELDDTVIERVREIVAENVALRGGLAAAHQYVKGGCVCATGGPHNHPVCAKVAALLNTEAKP